MSAANWGLGGGQIIFFFQARNVHQDYVSELHRNAGAPQGYDALLQTHCDTPSASATTPSSASAIAGGIAVGTLRFQSALSSKVESASAQARLVNTSGRFEIHLRRLQHEGQERGGSFLTYSWSCFAYRASLLTVPSLHALPSKQEKLQV